MNLYSLFITHFTQYLVGSAHLRPVVAGPLTPKPHPRWVIVLVSVDITPTTVMFSQQEEKSAERYSQIKLMNHYYLEFAWVLFYFVCLFLF